MKSRFHLYCLTTGRELKPTTHFLCDKGNIDIYSNYLDRYRDRCVFGVFNVKEENSNSIFVRQPIIFYFKKYKPQWYSGEVTKLYIKTKDVDIDVDLLFDRYQQLYKKLGFENFINIMKL